MTTRKKPIAEPIDEPISKPATEIPVEQTLEEVKVPPVAEKTAPLEIREPEITNSFYDAIGLRYCRKCGESKRTDSNTKIFCPAAKAKCRGLID